MADVMAFLRTKSCDGDGSGYGDGDGCGYGYGDGSGFGYRSGIKSINGETVHSVDGVETIIRRVHGNIAKGSILNTDLTLAPCYIVKQDDKLAHGETLRKAMEALRYKLFEDMDEDDRIAAFVREHEWGKQYPDTDFFHWHHRLTGSCELGRNAFARDRGLEKLDGAHTVEWFIELTKNAYGGEVIRKVQAAYGRG